MNTPASQTGASAVATTEKQLVDWGVAKDEKTGEHSLIRFKFSETLVPEVLSQNQPPRVVEFFRGDGDAKISVGSVILTTLQLKRWIWAKAKCDGASEILRRCHKLPAPILDEVRELARGKTVLCEVIVGREERIPQVEIASLSGAQRPFLPVRNPLGCACSWLTGCPFTKLSATSSPG